MGGCAGDSDSAPTTAPPRAGDVRNILLITIDTLRADALGCYGRSPSPSPNLDRIAAEGTLFEQCTSSSPSTLPSHATILTGKHPYAHGARSNAGFVLPEANVTIAERLADAGWTTAAEIAAPVINRSKGLDQGFAQYRDLDSPGVERAYVVYAGNPKPRELPERRADDIARQGVAFLRAQGDQPFFLWLHYFDPHRPYLPHGSQPSVDDWAGYLGEVAHVDRYIDVVMKELARLQLAEHTLVAITADHGEGLGDHGEKTHSFFLYDSTVRVPLILRGPQIPSNQRLATLVRTIDIAPTLLDFAAAPPLEDAHGVSLRGVLRKEAASTDTLAYGESLEPFALFDSSILRYVREGDWKYIHKLDPELYDVRRDPGERTNLAGQNPETVEALRSRLRALVESAGGASAEARVSLTDEARDKLVALGYVGAAPPSTIDDEVAALEVKPPDPSAKTEDIALYTEALFELRRQRFDLAIAKFNTGWQRNPQSLPFLEALIGVLIKADRQQEAIPLLRTAMNMGSESLRYRIILAQVESEAGNYDLAEQHLRKAMAVEPDQAGPYIELANVFETQKLYEKQREVFEAGLKVDAESLELLNNYAMLLAACPVDEFRDGQRAVQLATEAVRLTQGIHPSVLDTLSVAYAEIGDFDKALKVAGRALELLKGRDQPELIRSIREHAMLYQAGRPVRLD